jgi:hypothetical protein
MANKTTTISKPCYTSEWKTVHGLILRGKL